MKISVHLLRSPCFRQGVGKSHLMPGKPHARLVLVSTWNSGSYFTLKLLATHPGAYLHPEPIKFLGIKRINSNSDEERAHEVPNFVANIIKCNTSAFKGEGFLQVLKSNKAK